jgi:hypothetical protein|tara:strand:+ start:11690 stop:12016 length:327 start_codon:yes stop_codon:yes gene_type:complete
MNERELCETLERAENKIWSCGCPYLALSEEMGYVSAWAATHDPHLGLSNLGRIGVTDCLKTSGFNTEYSQFIYEMIEKGHTMDKIGNRIMDGTAKKWNYWRWRENEDE